MERNAAVSVNIHSTITKADAKPNIGGALTLYFGDYPHINFFTGSPALCADLAAAINAVIERHKVLEAVKMKHDDYDEHNTLNRVQQGLGRGW